jgi:ketosteroid isomerase-like protein
MRIWVAFALLSALAMPARADLAQDVRCREVGFSRSVEAHDLESFSSFVDSDARFVGSRVDRGREAVTKAWAVFFTGDLPSIKWRPQIIEVLETGDLALSRGLYRVIDKDENGAARESWGTFNSVWRLNADGQWLVVFDAGSPSHEAPSDAQRKLLQSDAGCD